MKPSVRKISGKNLMIDRDNSIMLIVISIASFLVIFSLFASKALFSQSGYQSRVIGKKEKALKQLQDNNEAVSQLIDSYKSFATAPVNMLEGDPKGNKPNDGDNPKIVLDALPSKYDFPGLVSSTEKLLKDGGYKIESLGGTDDEIAQKALPAAGTPAAIEIPFPVSVTTNYDGAKNFLSMLERSIRPVYVKQLDLTAAAGQLKISVTASTFYQPEKVLTIGSEVVK